MFGGGDHIEIKTPRKSEAWIEALRVEPDDWFGAPPIRSRRCQPGTGVKARDLIA